MVELKDIVKNFGKTEVLKEISLSVREGEFISLVGPSGCGKSTLLKILAGLDDPSSGEVRIDDQCVNDLYPRERNIAMVFQSYALYPHMTVRGNLFVPLILERLKRWQRLPLLRAVFTRKYKKELNGRVEETANLLHISPLLERKPAQLSGGQKQRVALGRAMVRNPRIFLMDEPLSNLDAKLRVIMRAEIVQLHRRLGSTFIYVTHDQSEAMTMSDRIAVMMDGHILQLGTPREVYKNPSHIKVAEFIGSPRINLLPGVVTEAQSVRVMGQDLPLRVSLPAGEEVQIGFRPEAVRINRRHGWKGEVIHTEYLGSDLMLFIQFENREDPIIVRADNMESDEIQLGTVLTVFPRKKKTLIFDSSGNRVFCEPVDEASAISDNSPDEAGVVKRDFQYTGGER